MRSLDSFRLARKTALIEGRNRGIGEATIYPNGKTLTVDSGWMGR